MHKKISPLALRLAFNYGLRRTLLAGLVAALPLAFAGNALAASNVIVSQVYGGGGNSGAVYKNDFIELFNRSTVAVSLNGMSVQYASDVGTVFQVSALPNVTLQPGQYFLVQQAAGLGGTTSLPTPDAIGSLMMSSTGGKVVLANTTTAVTSATSPAVLDLVAFGPNAKPFEGRSPTAAPTNTTAVLRADGGCYDSDFNGVDFVVANPLPRNRSTALNPCVVPSAAITRTIAQIQGSGSTSTLVGTAQTTQGVVTLKLANGFYLQDPAGDANAATSEGIFVFVGSAPAVNVGDRVRVSATVAEFSAGDATRPITQLSQVTATTVLGKGNVIAPTSLSLPLANATDWEKYEGMLVRFSLPLTVSQNYFLGRFGQLTLSGSRLEIPTNRHRPGSAAAIALRASNNANFVVLDDTSSVQNPNPIPYIGQDSTIRSGDTVTGLTGVVDFGSISSSTAGPAGYKLQPTIAPVFVRKNSRTAAPGAVGGNIKVASFNVLNFFSTFTNGTTADGQTNQGCKVGTVVSKSNCRGADNLAEFNRQRVKIAAAMKAIDADVFGLMEMQNNGNTAISYLVSSLNTLIGSNTYAYLPVPADPAAMGTDAIRVAIIYKPAKLTPVGPSLTDINPVNSRPPLAQTFVASTGKRFSLIVNHFKSKGSCPTDGSRNTDQGDGQGCWNALRVEQATRSLSFIRQVQTAANDLDVLSIGDFNANGAEDPIFTLQNGGLVNQIERFIRPKGMPYSFVFDGESGYLDNALATASMSSKVTGVAEWHINADEPVIIDYNTDFKTQDLYTSGPYRASDHDPVIIGLNLQATTVKAAAPKATGKAAAGK
ncbi:MAG: hypothetical protein RL748_3849 [Pseudomonadota bacterium]